MTWANRFRLWGGLLLVVLIVAACTVVFAQRQARATSFSGEVRAPEYTLGADYPGTVVSVPVAVGQQVHAGDVIMEIDSPILRRLVADDPTDTASESALTDQGTVQVIAPADGVVAELDVLQGGYASGGSPVATMYGSGQLTAVAEFTLTRRDFGRIEQGSAATLLLPDETEVEGTVDGVEVSTVAGEATATVTITSDALTSRAWDGLVVPGAPVQATIDLRDDGILAGTHDLSSDFLQKIGLG